jgi:hypothetical protein
MHQLFKRGQNCTGPFRIILEDIAGQKTWFGSVATTETWETYMIPVGSETDALWNKDAGNTRAFDWTAIKRISIDVVFTPGTIGIYRIDAPHFTTVVPGRRNIFVFVYEKGEILTPLANINVIHGAFAGMDPATGQEKYFWDYNHIKKTDDKGSVTFTELLPIVYGIRVEDPAHKYKPLETGRIDVRDSDKNVSALLEPYPIQKPEQLILPLVLFGSVIIAGVSLTQA